jgi:small ligand-binding sensory domain FIST
MSFCERHLAAAKSDLLRMGAEVREALEPEEVSAQVAAAFSDEACAQPRAERGMRGAIYVSCAGRGGPHFGHPSAELQILRKALGDVPLVGFFAGGEIAHKQLLGYTGVLTVFV